MFLLEMGGIVLINGCTTGNYKADPVAVICREIEL